MTVQGPSSGWFPDPWQPNGQIRWWSGTEWTADIRVTPQIAREVDFGEAVKRGFRGWNKWSGRASLTEYWWWFLFGSLITYAFYFVGYFFAIGAFLVAAPSDPVVATSDGSLTTDTGGLSTAILVALGVAVLVAIMFIVFIVVPWLAVAARRLHDSGRSAAWLWLFLVPVAQLFLLVFLAMPSTPVHNEYGPVPA